MARISFFKKNIALNQDFFKKIRFGRARISLVGVNKSGFTLVELMVSITIFLLAMIVVSEIFSRAVRAHRHLLAQTQIVNELSYDLERIGRGLRQAKKAKDSSCIAQNSNFETNIDQDEITFLMVGQDGLLNCVKFYREPQPNGKYALMEKRFGAAVNFDLPITSPDINILEFKVYSDDVFGWSQTDYRQPRAVLHVKAEGKNGAAFEGQLAVSQRSLDLLMGP